MSVDASLFGDDPAEPTPSPPAADKPEALPTWQIDALRAALDRCGVTAMDARQRLVVEIVGHPITALKDLTAAEAGVLRNELRRRSTEIARNGSAWDERDGETWIDRL